MFVTVALHCICNRCNTEASTNLIMYKCTRLMNWWTHYIPLISLTGVLKLIQTIHSTPVWSKLTLLTPSIHSGKQINCVIISYVINESFNIYYINSSSGKSKLVSLALATYLVKKLTRTTSAMQTVKQINNNIKDSTNTIITFEAN